MKKLFTYIFSLLLCVTMFAGCNLISLNKGKYYEQTVAQIVYDKNHKQSFSMQDLLEAYNNYGNQLTQNNQEITGEEVLKQTAELMVQRYMLVQEIKKEISLTTEEKNVLKRQTYEHINTTLAGYEDKIRVEWDRDVVEETTEEAEEETLRAEYTPYEPTVVKEYYEENVNGSVQLKHRLVRVEEETEDEDTTDPGEFKQAVTDADISAEAWKRYVKDLQENYEDLGKEYSEEKVFQDLKGAAIVAQNFGLKVNAGHGLNYQNVKRMHEIPNLVELNIGHTIIARSIFVGLEAAIKEMKNLVSSN
jgi:hypothetical protein